VDLIETLRSTGAAREFRPGPVPDEVVARILDNARFAPSGGNHQGWHVVVLKDPSRRRALRDLYLPGWRQYLAMRAAGLVPWAPLTDERAERAAVEQAETSPPDAGPFAEHFDEIPVLLALFADLRALAAVDRGFDRDTLAGGASIYPFAWSILLAARAEGLGGVLTTMPIRRESQVKDLLRAPDHFVLAGVLALGHPVNQPHRLTRRPVQEFTTVDGFDGPSFGAG
jgi:nitroreductase